VASCPATNFARSASTADGCISSSFAPRLQNCPPRGSNTDHTCERVDQDEEGATVAFAQTTTGRPLGIARADAVIACEGINSAIRKQVYPNDDVAIAGINSRRGVTRRKPILSGRSYIRAGRHRRAHTR
jgi:2-polyprenyl-6-methoxyphenol hydroxylase-like FAD-dependent oxidoreductase